MADYVSKYTGNEVDGILDEAIELPQASSSDEGKVLTVNSTGEPSWQTPNSLPMYVDNSGENSDIGKCLIIKQNEGPVWDNPIDTSGASDGNVLKYDQYNGIIWDNPIDTSVASDGEFLKYSSNTGVMWDNPLDTSEASEGQVLKYTGDTHPVEWGDPIDTSGASDGQFLKYSGTTGIMWDYSINTSGASNGKFLKYGSNGLEWDNVIDTSNAQNGQFLKYSSDTGMMWETLSVFPSGAVGGSILTYNDDSSSLTWAAGSGTEGQVLTYVPVAGGSGYTVEWADVDRFPVYDTSDPSNDAGKVLTVLGNGTLGWILPNQ